MLDIPKLTKTIIAVSNRYTVVLSAHKGCLITLFDIRQHFGHRLMIEIQKNSFFTENQHLI